MKAKTYRVTSELSKAACEKMIEYITEKQEAVTEAQIINASIDKGIKDLTHEDIGKFIEGQK